MSHEKTDQGPWDWMEAIRQRVLERQAGIITAEDHEFEARELLANMSVSDDPDRVRILAERARAHLAHADYLRSHPDAAPTKSDDDPRENR